MMSGRHMDGAISHLGVARGYTGVYDKAMTVTFEATGEFNIAESYVTIPSPIKFSDHSSSFCKPSFTIQKSLAKLS